MGPSVYLLFRCVFNINEYFKLKLLVKNSRPFEFGLSCYWVKEIISVYNLQYVKCKVTYFECVDHVYDKANFDMIMQWLCNADKSSHNPRLRLKYVPFLVYCAAFHYL